MQSIVSKKGQDDDDKEEKEVVDSTHNVVDKDDGPFKYSQAVEPMTYGADDSNLKQVEAKILDFNWVFIGDNSQRLTQILSTTDNDEIFATS